MSQTFRDKPGVFSQCKDARRDVVGFHIFKDKRGVFIDRNIQGGSGVCQFDKYLDQQYGSELIYQPVVGRL